MQPDILGIVPLGNSVTAHAVAFGVLMFPCVIASQLQSTANIVGLFPVVTNTPTTMQPDDPLQSIGKDRPVENIASTKKEPLLARYDINLYFSYNLKHSL